MSDGPNTPGGGDGAQDPPPPPPGSSPPASPQVPGAGRSAGRPADLGPRFLARLIDSIILGVAYSVIIVPLFIGAMFGMGGGFGVGGNWAASAVSSLLGTALTLGYFAVMESSRGQTVGKMLLKLRVEGPAGANPSLEEAFKRNLWLALGLLSIIPFVGWLLAGPAQLAAAIFIAVTINNAASRQGWHDEFAGGTRVVHLS